MTVSSLIQGAEYYFTVVGIDAGGRVGEDSALSERLTLDGEELMPQLWTLIPERWFA